MRIGVIGSGRIGATLAQHWVRAGHKVRVGSRDPAATAARAASLGAMSASQAEAAAFGDVVFTAVPYWLWPELAAAIGPSCRGKLVMDAANPYPHQDGDFAQAALDARQGSAVPVGRLLPGAFYVRAFNTLHWETLRDEAGRIPKRLAVPLVGDDPASLDTAARLVTDAGFDPLVVGPLCHATTFDVGAQVYGAKMTADEMERVLGLIPPG